MKITTKFTLVDFVNISTIKGKEMTERYDHEFNEYQQPPTTLLEMSEYLKYSSVRESSPSRTHGLTIVVTGASR
jgi:hypothetical protein